MKKLKQSDTFVLDTRQTGQSLEMAALQFNEMNQEDVMSDSELLKCSQSMEDEVRQAVVKEARETGEWCKDLAANVYLYISSE